jgi:PBSX family phage terminase large subunit
MWVTTTPKGKLNWVYSAAQKMKVFRATSLDNPFVSEDWKQSLLDNYTGAFLRQEVYGDFIQFEGLVYNMFDAAQHVKKMDIASYLEFGLAIDEGYTNPCVILKIYTDHDDNYYIAEEYYKTGKLQSEIVDNVVQMAGSFNPDIVVDSSAAGLIAAIRDKGLTAVPRKGGVIDGIKKVQDAFAKGKLIIDPSCVNTISDLESYVWKEGKDEPVKEFDHAPDAIRYFINRGKRVLVATQKRW